MTENFYTIADYNNHSTFGGLIYNYDFDGYVSMADMAERITSDWKFDEKCRKLANNNSKKRKELQMAKTRYNESEL